MALRLGLWLLEAAGRKCAVQVVVTWDCVMYLSAKRRLMQNEAKDNGLTHKQRFS